MSKSAMKKAAKNADRAATAVAPPKAAKAKAESADADASGGGAGSASSAAPAKKAAVERFDYINTTPPGQKKDMSGEMLPAYHPQQVEAAWDSWWAASGFYSCEPAHAEAAGEGGRFVMVIPPPNVTGSLHLGHALTSAVEDCLTRWHRMRGRPTMWLPGTDHAGIATQSVVEKRLKKERGVTRHDLGRENFLKEVWAWKETYGANITRQLRHLAVSTDWSREAFTMDANLNRAVNEAFVRMHESGLVYRDDRLVNWCCQLQSAISNEEVDKVELEARRKLAVPGHNPAMTYEFGLIWSIAYKVADSAEGEELVIATTRPETLLGDTAVAVHPSDARYAHLHGRFLVHPFDGRRIPVITDGLLVDMALGTGAVKVTPAHDENDFKCGKRHGLPFVTVIAEDGRMAVSCPAPFAGMMRYDARYAICKALEEKGLMRGKADNKMALSVCSRTGDVIEPLMKPQWYIKCDGMAKRASDAVRSGELTILPDIHHGVWFSYMDNIRDWCVSRQLWWGHRIPAYFATVEGRPRGDDATSWFVARSEEEARAQAAARFCVPAASISLEQDEDVLDTWFSSGLFPFSTFGWPDEQHADFKAFYPNSLLETGHDILFFWVARMVMMGLQLTGKLPFRTVYLHAMVRDKEGRKMSKSKGNVIDPMEVIYGCDLETLHQKVRDGNLPAKEVELAIKGQRENFPDGLPECGADALRFGLLAYTVQGRDINLDVGRVVGYRQFCNKLWNATRFALTHLAADRYAPAPHLDTIDELLVSPSLAVRDRWVLSRLGACVAAVDAALKSYSFGAATNAIYSFFLYELCDYYLELLKPLMQQGESAALAAADAGGDVALAQRLARSTLHVCLELGFRLLHPMMPMLTEELWQRLPGRGVLPLRAAHGGAAAVSDWPSIVIAAYPDPALLPGFVRPDVEAAFALFQEVLRAGRGLRAEKEILPSRLATFFVQAKDAAERATLEAQRCDLMTLLRCDCLHIVAEDGAVGDGCAASVVSDRLSVYLLLKGLIDPAAEAAKLEKKAERVAREAEIMQRRVGAPGYAEKVPAAVRAQNAEALAKLLSERDQLLKLMRQHLAEAAEAAAPAAEVVAAAPQ